MCWLADLGISKCFQVQPEIMNKEWLNVLTDESSSQLVEYWGKTCLCTAIYRGNVLKTTNTN